MASGGMNMLQDEMAELMRKLLLQLECLLHEYFSYNWDRCSAHNASLLCDLHILYVVRHQAICYQFELALC